MTDQKIIPIKAGNASLAVTPQAIRSQLGKILSSDAFIRSRRIQRFLEFIVEEALAGRADQLKEYGIGVAVFDKSDDFEPAVDPIVRNEARRLRLKLIEYYGQTQSREGDQVMIDIPKGAYVPVFAAAASREEKGIPQVDRPRRLAVLPFDVLSAALESTMVGQALCMSLTANLTNVDGLEAVAHGYFRNQPIRESALELQLSHAIHGSILSFNNRCRVIVNLIHIADGTQLWAHEYEFDHSEMLSFQSEITGAVLREVTAHLGLRRQQLAYFAQAA